MKRISFLSLAVAVLAFSTNASAQISDKVVRAKIAGIDLIAY